MWPVNGTGAKVFSHFIKPWTSPVLDTQLSSKFLCLPACLSLSRTCCNPHFFSSLFFPNPELCSYMLLNPYTPHKNKKFTRKEQVWTGIPMPMTWACGEPYQECYSPTSGRIPVDALDFHSQDQTSVRSLRSFLQRHPGAGSSKY